MPSGRLDAARIVAMAVLTAGFAVGVAEALLHYSSSAQHVGPTSAALSDGASEIAGACLGLAVGAMAAAALVRRGSRMTAGVLTGVLAFLIGVVPYSWLTSASDVSTGDNVVWLVILFVPALLLIITGAAVGAAMRRGTGAGPASGSPAG